MHLVSKKDKHFAYSTKDRDDRFKWHEKYLPMYAPKIDHITTCLPIAQLLGIHKWKKEPNQKK